MYAPCFLGAKKQRMKDHEEKLKDSDNFQSLPESLAVGLGGHEWM